MSEKKKGLLAYIYMSDLGPCDNGAGLCSKVKRVTILPSKDFPMSDAQVFEPTEDAPAVVIVKRGPFGRNSEPYLTAYPADEDGNPDTEGRMDGGAFISACDSRFPATYPVPLHDRKEW